MSSRQFPDARSHSRAHRHKGNHTRQKADDKKRKNPPHVATGNRSFTHNLFSFPRSHWLVNLLNDQWRWVPLRRHRSKRVWSFEWPSILLNLKPVLFVFSSGSSQGELEAC